MKVKKKKKKKKEKAAVRGRQQKSQHISQPLSTGLRDGWDSSRRDSRGQSTYRARESEGCGSAGIQDAHRAGLLPRHQRRDALKVRAASWLRLLAARQIAV